MSSAAAGVRRAHARVGGSESDSKIHQLGPAYAFSTRSPLPVEAGRFTDSEAADTSGPGGRAARADLGPGR